jgi:hypothetical protein
MPTWAIVAVSVALSLAISNLAGSLSRGHIGEDGAVAAPSWVHWQQGKTPGRESASGASGVSDQRLVARRLQAQPAVLAQVHGTSTLRGVGAPTGLLQQAIAKVGGVLRGTVNVGAAAGTVTGIGGVPVMPQAVDPGAAVEPASTNGWTQLSETGHSNPTGTPPLALAGGGQTPGTPVDATSLSSLRAPEGPQSMSPSSLAAPSSPVSAERPLKTTHRCSRMQPWGDICHYEVRFSLCMIVIATNTLAGPLHGDPTY